MFKVLIVAIAIMLSGCATDPEVTRQLIAHNEKQQGIATFEITCPPQGCQFSSVKYTDPRDRANLKMPTNGYDALIAVSQQGKELLSGAIPVFGMYKLGTSIANKGFDTAAKGLEMKSGDTITTTNANQANTSNANVSNANQANTSNANVSNANQANTSNANVSNANQANTSNANVTTSNANQANTSNANVTTSNANQANTSNANVTTSNANPATTNNMTSSTGVLGTGTYGTTSTSTLGTGVLGSGTYTTTDNTSTPTVVK
jgi:hypothetical protein